MSPEESNAAPAHAQQFPVTHWSVILSGAGTSSEQAGRAVQHLCEAYWHPIYNYLRRSGRSPVDAQDLTQSFFARVIAKDYLSQVDPNRGRFRSFLLGALKHFLADEWDRQQAVKRGGRYDIISLDQEQEEGKYLLTPTEDLSPDRVFDRRWALAVLERALHGLEQELVAQGRGEIFAGLRDLIAGGREAGFAQAAARVGMTEGAAKMAVQRMRHRYRELLRAEVRRTVETERETDEELRYLLELLSQ